MRAGKRMWIIGLFILLTVSVSAYALTLPSFGNLAGISDLGGGFLPLIGKAFVNGGIIFIVVAGFANLFSMFENKKPQTGTIMYAMMFAVSLVAAMFLFGNDFVWQHELVRNIVNRWVLVNGLMFFALGFGITNMPFFNKYKGESKGGQAATALITIALAVFLARYFDNLYTNTYFWQMPWFGLLGTVFRNLPVFIGMSVIYYFIMGVLMEKTKGIGQPGRIALAVFLGFQAAL
ncbi:hypothetical protein KY345_02135, partial [Candidatus Woesearchaeota archaeon]|nr:hypothetical protein [Candidatus Woesearchaeota archaeon]